jgi:hypothetical protein
MPKRELWNTLAIGTSAKMGHEQTIVKKFKQERQF